MALLREQILAGDTVVIPAFRATVVDTYATIGCVEVKDADGKRHFIYLNQLNKPVPYEDDALYVNRYNDCYVYKAADDDISPGKWLPVSSLNYDEDEYDDSDLVSYTSPSRPLRQVAFGDELND